MATIRDVAKVAGVSITTVSRVLNNTAPVSEETRNKVLKAINELNYTPSIMAQGMRTKKSKAISIIIPDFINPFYHELFKYVEDAARKEGYHLVVSSTGEDAQDDISCIKELINRNVDGLIICTYKGDKETVEYILEAAKKIPVIFLDNFEIDKQVSAVFTDGYAGIKEIVHHLIKLGHKDIGFIKSIPRYKVANDRYHGYIDALSDEGIPFRDFLVFEGDYHIQSGFEAAKYFLTSCPVRPSAIVSSTDLMAIGAMNFIKSQGLEIPKDIALAGFDDIYMSKLMSPPLTTYKQPIELIAKEAVKLILHKMAHPNAKNKKIVLKGELIVRRSTDSLKDDFEYI